MPLLAERFLAEAAARLRVPAKQFAPAALARLQGHAWPGNVRELQNLCWRVAVLAPSDVVGPADLDGALAPATSVPAPTRAGDWESALSAWATQALAAGDAGSLHARARERLDRALLAAALARSGGNRGEAAALLGLGRNTVTRKLAADRGHR